MEAILQAFNGIITIFIIIATGFVLAKKGWFSEESTTLISRLVTQITLPTMMLSSIMRNFSHDSLLSLSKGLPIPIISMALGYVLGHLSARALGVREDRRGIFCSVYFVSNVVFIGLPLAISLFGEACVPYVMVYYMVNTSFFWVLTAHDIAVDGGVRAPFLSKATVRSILSPPLTGFLLGVALVLLDLKIPAPILRSVTYIGSMTTPLAMFFIGIAMSRTDWSQVHVDKEICGAMLGRYLVSPLLVLLLAPLFSVSREMTEVFVMMSAMPAMTNTSIVARYYGADYKYAALLTVVSTCLAVAVVPFYMWILRG